MTTSTLFGPEGAWSLEPVAVWLFTEGRRLRDPVVFLEALAAQLEAVGAHVDRIAFMSRTLHPQLVGWAAHWGRKSGVRRDGIEHGARSSDAYVGSPVQYVTENQKAMSVIRSMSFEGPVVISLNTSSSAQCPPRAKAILSLNWLFVHM